MNWIKGFIKFWKSIQIILLYMASILFVYFMFPREGKFQFEYTKNKPWMHETLVAPFDFPIYKPEQQVQLERDSLLGNARLYFFYDTLVGNSMLNAFEVDYRDAVSSLRRIDQARDSRADVGSLISGILREIYEKGVIERHPVLEGKQIDDLPVMVCL